MGVGGGSLINICRQIYDVCLGVHRCVAFDYHTPYVTSGGLTGLHTTAWQVCRPTVCEGIGAWEDESAGPSFRKPGAGTTQVFSASLPAPSFVLLANSPHAVQLQPAQILGSAKRASPPADLAEPRPCLCPEPDLATQHFCTVSACLLFSSCLATHRGSLSCASVWNT